MRYTLLLTALIIPLAAAAPATWSPGAELYPAKGAALCSYANAFEGSAGDALHKLPDPRFKQWQCFLMLGPDTNEAVIGTRYNKAFKYTFVGYGPFNTIVIQQQLASEQSSPYYYEIFYAERSSFSLRP